MRKYVVLLVAIGLFVAAPASAVMADSHRSLAIVLVEEVNTGVADDGALLAEGTFTVRVDDTLVQQGTVSSKYYLRENGRVIGYRTYLASDGTSYSAQIWARARNVDPVSETTSYNVKEFAGFDITVAGRTVVVGTEDAFSLSGYARWVFSG